MKLEMVTKDVVRETMVREFIHRKIQFAFERFDDQVREVVVRLRDETKNAPVFRGLCSIEVGLEPDVRVQVSARGESSYDCVLNALRKMEQALMQNVDCRWRRSRDRRKDAKQEFAEVAEPA